MRTFAEFHDSRVGAISQNGDEVVIDFPHVYIYQFEGEPFQQPGAGYSQVGRLVFSGVDSVEIPDLSSDDRDETSDIWGGSIWVNGEHLNSVFEIPLNAQSSTVQAEIRFLFGHVFKITCTGVSYTGLSDPEFMERYRT